MTKKILLTFFILTLMLSVFSANLVSAETDYIGKVVKVEGRTTLYYIASDGNRYIYPNEKTYKSWHLDFSEVLTITKDELDQYPLAGNIRYRPGIVLVKFVDSPRIFAVKNNGKIKWITTANLAKKLYGENWNLLIDEVPTILVGDYEEEDPIDEEGDYDADEEINNTDSIESNRGFALGHYKIFWKSKTIKCRAVPAIPGGKGKKTTPAISARQCKVNLINEGTTPEEDDTTAPVISEVAVAQEATTATVTWATDEQSNSKIEYADESLTTASTTEIITESELITSHSLILTGLTAETTYYYTIQSSDASSNIATTTESTFTTNSVVVPDTTSPIITEISATVASTTATIAWNTDELSNSKVEYADESLTTSTSTEELIESDLVLSHLLELTNLTASTTYHFIVVSTDANNNAATTTEDTFITDSE